MPQVENLSESEISELQKVFFDEVSKSLQNSKKLPMTVTVGPMEEQSLRDLQELREKGLIAWDLELKCSPYMEFLPNQHEHRISCIVYYGNAEEGYCCIGFALGCFNFKTNAFELHFIEKRKDSGKDWERAFFPLIMGTFLAYIELINADFEGEINQFVIVTPLESVRRYYRGNGFELLTDKKYSKDYDEVMVKYMEA